MSVVPFKPKEKPLRRPWTSNAPTLSPFGGSLEGATEQEVQLAAVKQNPMRLLVRKRCTVCEHRWQQPAATGKCPNCHSDRVEVLHALPMMAQRV